MLRSRAAFPLLAVVLLSACATAPTPKLASGEAAYTHFAPASPDGPVQPYRIGPLDSLNITVFQEPDLTREGVQVDASGTISVPLIGDVVAAGKTTTELSREMERRFGERFLRNPQVTIVVATSVSQKVTVDGSVTQAGVFAIQGRTSLLEAIAMARGTSRVAALNHVAIFRTIDGQQMGAVFDVAAIRRGEQPDPEIQGNDVVIVGLNNIKAVWRDLLTALPAFGIFRPFN